jgi:hypothetical protein
MAATGFTPISLYHSTTAAAAPTAGNLVPGELALNITDGKLYYEDNLGVVKLLASSASVLTLPVSISNGGTGATTIAGAQTNLQVDPAGTAVAMSIALG